LKEVNKIQKVPPNLWLVHGKLYNFENFLDTHPGGKTFLLLGMGKDCTELFEGVHSLSNRNFKELFDKYQVSQSDLDEEYKNIEYTDFFEWNDSGFF